MNRAALLLCAAWAAGCGERVEGLRVELRVAGGLGTDGGALRVERATLQAERVELFACATAFRLPRFSLIQPAWAHDDAAQPTVWSGPVTLELTEPMTHLGVLRPPPGSYCGARLTVSGLSLSGTLAGAPWSSATSARRSLNAALSDLALDERNRSAALVWTLGPGAWSAGLEPAGQDAASVALGLLPPTPTVVVTP